MSIDILIQIPLGGALYITGSKLFKIDSFEYLLSIIKGFLRKGRK